MAVAQHPLPACRQKYLVKEGFRRNAERSAASGAWALFCGAVVARAGVEPATFHFSGERCYQLSYLASPGRTGTGRTPKR
jgi:hypothetical protein